MYQKRVDVYTRCCKLMVMGNIGMMQDVVRELLVTRIIQKRKLKRHLQRHATEMGAARLTGISPPPPFA